MQAEMKTAIAQHEDDDGDDAASGMKCALIRFRFYSAPPAAPIVSQTD